jgi:uncharacterized protein (TIGR02001 family)
MFDLPPPDPAFEFSVASRGMSKGIAQTEGPQVILRGLAKSGPFEAGGQWKNVTSSTARGEAAAFINASHSFGKLRLNAGAAYKFQTGVTGPTDSESWEFTGGATASFGKVSLRATAIYSPDDLGSARRSLYLEGGPTLELSKTLRASANVGRRERKNGDDYTSFNLGVTKTFEKSIIADLRYYDTAQSELGENFEHRLVAALRVTF